MRSIGTIHLPTSARPGESVALSVSDQNGVAFTHDDPEEVDINGQVGANQHVQFAYPGHYSILVRLRDRQGLLLDSATATISVSGQAVVFEGEGGLSLPILNVVPSMVRPYEFRFVLGELLSAFHPQYVSQTAVFPQDRSYTWRVNAEPAITTKTPFVDIDCLWRIDHGRQHSTIDVSVHILPGHVTARKTLSLSSLPFSNRSRGVSSPLVRSDEQAIIGDSVMTCVLQLHNVTEEALTLTGRSITCLTHDPSGDALDVPGAEVLFESPLAVPAGASVSVISVLRTGSDVVRNSEAVVLRFRGESAGLEVQANATFDLRLHPGGIPLRDPIAEPSSWPWDVLRTALREVNQTEGQHTPEFSIDKHTATIIATFGSRPETEDLLRIGEQSAAAIRGRFEDGQRVAIEALTKSRTRGGSAPGFICEQERTELPDMGSVVEGGFCDPDNISDEQWQEAISKKLAPGLSNICAKVTRPTRWLNARMGDIVLSPNDGLELVGALLASLTPPQKYSHSGIMTKNYSEVTHSTVSQEWITSKVKWIDVPGFSGGPTRRVPILTDGVDPESLRHLWPGALTQSVGNAIAGEKWIAPRDPNHPLAPGDPPVTYSIASFAQASAGLAGKANKPVTTGGGTSTSAARFGTTYTPAAIVKPPAYAEVSDLSLRTRLHRLSAEIAKHAAHVDETGQAFNFDGLKVAGSGSHYRLFCFTDPTISITQTATPGHGWATETFPSVCSVLLWRGMRKLNYFMGPNDGLTAYSQNDRTNAAQRVFSFIYDMLFQLAGDFGEALTDISDDWANQFTNAFASDASNGTDSDAWKQPGSSMGVSPDNISGWAGPDDGGLFGHLEQAEFRGARSEHYRLSTWQSFTNTGVISGKIVRAGGTAIPGVRVQITDRLFGISNSLGDYTIHDVPYGTPGTGYTLTTSLTIEHQCFFGSADVMVQSPTTDANITMEAPSLNRLVTLVAKVKGNDSEWAATDEKFEGTKSFVRSLTSNEFQTTVTPQDGFKFAWGGEIRVEYTAVLFVLGDGSVQVRVYGLFFEGTTEYTGDLDGFGVSHAATVAPGESGELELSLSNLEEGSADDKATLTVRILNQALGS